MTSSIPVRCGRWILLLLAAGARAGDPAATFNYVAGTQTFGPAYQFTEASRLEETADGIHALGATVIKFELAPRYAEPKRGNARAARADIKSLADLARLEPTHRRVLDGPFAFYQLWVHAFAGGPERWMNGLAPEYAKQLHREMYDLAAHLLRTYSGSGKTFYLGHWEGDGWLRHSVARSNDVRVTEVAVQGMVDWLTIRQRAIDEARRDTPHTNVWVWHYTEVNHVRLALEEGRPAVVNRVLPRVPVDYVSYSCYDTQKDPALLKRALDYIEARLTPKPGLPPGRRVFIGEYGFPTVWHDPEEQAERSRQVLVTALEWGCPFALYWAFYNNEVEEGGRQRGFWMIDDRGQRQPVYELHRRYYDWARGFVRDTVARTGQPPAESEFRAAALEHLRREGKVGTP